MDFVDFSAEVPKYDIQLIYLFGRVCIFVINEISSKLCFESQVHKIKIISTP